MIEFLWETPGWAEKRGFNGDDELTFELLDAHVEKIWREKFAGGEAVYYREILSEDAGAAMLAKHGVKVVRNFSDPVKAESFYNDLEESVKTNQEAA